MNTSQLIAGRFEISDPQKDLPDQAGMSCPWHLDFAFGGGA